MRRESGWRRRWLDPAGSPGWGPRSVVPARSRRGADRRHHSLQRLACLAECPPGFIGLALVIKARHIAPGMKAPAASRQGLQQAPIAQLRRGGQVAAADELHQPGRSGLEPAVAGGAGRRGLRLQAPQRAVLNPARALRTASGSGRLLRHGVVASPAPPGPAALSPPPGPGGGGRRHRAGCCRCGGSRPVHRSHR